METNFKLQKETITQWGITKREMEVIKWISSELTTTQIASLLHLSYHTVNSHRKNAMLKLHVKNTAGLIRRGFELGFLSINEGQAHGDW